MNSAARTFSGALNILMIFLLQVLRDLQSYTTHITYDGVIKLENPTTTRMFCTLVKPAEVLIQLFSYL